MSVSAFKEFMVGFLFENHETSILYSYQFIEYSAPSSYLRYLTLGSYTINFE